MRKTTSSPAKKPRKSDSPSLSSAPPGIPQRGGASPFGFFSGSRLILGICLLSSALAWTAPGLFAQSQRDIDRLFSPLGSALVRIGEDKSDEAREEIRKFEELWQKSGLASEPQGRTIEGLLAEIAGAAWFRDKGEEPKQALRSKLAELSKNLQALSDSKKPQKTQADVNRELAPLSSSLGLTLDALRGGDTGKAGSLYADFLDTWATVEGTLREIDSGRYGSMEIAISLARASLSAEPPLAEKALDELRKLETLLGDFLSGRAGSPDRNGAKTGVGDLLAILAAARAKVEEGKYQEAGEEFLEFLRLWPGAENEIRAGSPDAYARVESAMTEALAHLQSASVDTAEVTDRFDGIQRDLEPLVERQTYGAWHAGLILFREGLEAFLILAALLALLRKTGNEKRQVWIWAGAGSGLAASVILAFLLASLLSALSAATAAESLEGIVGLVSVALMLSVGAWLHARSNIQSWNESLKKNLHGALARGSLLSLASIAALAVLREGAETIIFYAGIISRIALADLLLGVGIALLVLGTGGYLVLKFSVKLPFHALFLGASLLIYFLSFKILGESLHTLQVSGILPIHPVSGFFSNEFFGTYPSWEVLLPQAALLVFVVLELAIREGRAKNKT